MKNHLKFSILVFVLISKSSFSQNDHISGVFPTLIMSHEFSDKWKIDSYSFLATNPFEKPNYPSRSSILYTELDLSYNFTKNFSTTLSYTYERLNPFSDDYRNENRIWLQAQYLIKRTNFEIKNRLRYDFRFIENRLTSRTDFNPRVRYLLGLTKPIFNKDKNINFVVYNEFFFNTFSNSFFSYAENWGYVGVHKKINKTISVELGYLNLSWVKDAQRNWLIQHYIQPSVYLSF